MMSDISGISDLSFDDSINDPDYGNPNSSIEVSDFENISEYETLCSSIQNTKKPNNTTFNVEYDDEVRVIEASDEEDDVQVIKGKKKLKILKIGNAINVRMQRRLEKNISVCVVS